MAASRALLRFSGESNPFASSIYTLSDSASYQIASRKGANDLDGPISVLGPTGRHHLFYLTWT